MITSEKVNKSNVLHLALLDFLERYYLKYMKLSRNHYTLIAFFINKSIEFWLNLDFVIIKNFNKRHIEQWFNRCFCIKYCNSLY